MARWIESFLLIEGVPSVGGLVDMMRYDCCFPAREAESARIEEATREHTPARFILCRRAHVDASPGRWRSFGLALLGEYSDCAEAESARAKLGALPATKGESRTFRLEINMENDAFRETPALEVAALLHTVAEEVEEAEGECEFPIRDANGNKVGKATGRFLLPSEIESDEIEGEVRAAAEDHFSDFEKLETVFEHGHWWVKVTYPEGAEQEEATFSVVDQDGDPRFGFEEV